MSRHPMFGTGLYLPVPKNPTRPPRSARELIRRIRRVIVAIAIGVICAEVQSQRWAASGIDFHHHLAIDPASAPRYNQPHEVTQR